jgi:Pyruvate phosphate dikinase, AMP/ATP-binding domain
VKCVVWFGEVDKTDGAFVGGKGANLGELTRAGIPLPSGCVVTSEVYFAFLDRVGLRPKIQELLTGIDVQARSIITTGEGDRPEENDSEARPRASAHERILTPGYNGGRWLGGGPV